MRVLDFKQDWDQYLPLVEFAYNNSYHSSISMPPYEALYGRNTDHPYAEQRWEKSMSKALTWSEK